MSESYAAASQAGAEVDLSVQDRPEQPKAGVLDEQARAQLRESLPEWDVQPFHLSRVVHVGDVGQDLQATVERIAQQSDASVTVILIGPRLRVVVGKSSDATGVTRQDAELAADLDALLSEQGAP